MERDPTHACSITHAAELSFVTVISRYHSAAGFRNARISSWLSGETIIKDGPGTLGTQLVEDVLSLLPDFLATEWFKVL